MPPADQHLESIFAADRALRAAEKELLAQPPGQVAELLVGQVSAAKKLEVGAERTMRLERLADLCAQVPGPKTIVALIDVLDEEETSTRALAGDALLDVAYDRYAEVARAIEQAVAANRQGPAMAELPWIVQEVGEPSALKLIGSFLKHRDAHVVASAIEALSELSDPDAIDLLVPLTKDTREAVVDEFEEETAGTIGQLATEAIAVLTMVGDLEDDLEGSLDDSAARMTVPEKKPSTQPRKGGPQPQGRGPRR